MEESSQVKYHYYLLTILILIIPFIIMNSVFHLEYHPTITSTKQLREIEKAKGPVIIDPKKKKLLPPEKPAFPKEDSLSRDRSPQKIVINSDTIPYSELDPKLVTLESNSDTIIIPGDQYFEFLESRFQEAKSFHAQNKKLRTDVVIRYYVHPTDGKKVYSLRKLGYYIHEREADAGLTNYESNSISYGDDVSEDDLVLVTYALLKAGMPIKKIALSAYHDSWKSRSIEIGADTAINNQPVLPLESLLQYASH